MATSGLYGSTASSAVALPSGSESSGLYGNNTVFGGTYFEWLIFKESVTAPSTPTGGSWNFTTNVGTPPTGWLNAPPTTPVNTVWMSIAVVNSKTTATYTWSAPAPFSQQGPIGPTGPAGSGNVNGPSSATDNAIARFDLTTGKLIQNSVVTISDAGTESGLEAIQFQTSPVNIPTAPGSLYWDSADGNQTLSLVMAGGTATQQIGEEQYFRIKASSAITNGQVVMFTGTVGASGALKGAPATGLTASTASYIMGIATQDIPLNGWGYVTSFGLVRGINTTGGAEAWADGQILYYDPTVAGGLTKTVPTAPNAKVQVCAVINASSGGSGSLFVRPSFGGVLGQYEGDVNISSPVTGQLLQYDGFKWFNTSTPTIAGNVNILTSTTNDQRFQVQNAGSYSIFGSESSTGGSYFTGSAAYATVFGSLNNTAVQIGTNGVLRTTFDTSGNLIQSAPTIPPSLATNGTMVFNLTSNTNLRVSVRGSDGVTRVANITLA